MNIKEYIESGQLELYVLGSLSEQENREVNDLLKIHPELVEEVNRIEQTLLGVSEAEVPFTLSSDILQGALNKIDNHGEQSSENGKVVPMRSSGGSSGAKKGFAILKIALAASVVGLIASLLVNYMLFDNLKEAQERVAILENENTVFADNFEVEKARYETAQSQLETLINPENKIIRMSGVEGKESSLATVYWNEANKTTIINVNYLPEPPAGMQYQLWALADGVPVDAGVFDVVEGVQEVKNIEKAQAFAVTLEKEGGVPSPNLEQLYVMGNV